MMAASCATATVALAVLVALLLAPTVRGAGGCELPPEWRGEWFQSDRAHLGPVLITRHNFTSTGTCIEKGKSNRYLIKEESYSNDEKYSCYKCMVINMKHRNVIQYKESYCDPLNHELVSLCHGITGDAMLFSMFRLDAAPHTCPFRGPLTFTYSRNLQECSHPVSQVDSCADDSRLLLRFQACADVLSSERYEEELVCLGSWQEGVNHYLVGKINHAHANSDNDRYRCFIYERAPHPDLPDATMMYLAQSADATCQGLISAYEGAKTMKLTRANQGSKKCKLPSWLTAHPHWHTLDYSQSYLVYHRNTSLKISNGTAAPLDPEVRGHTDLRLVCHEYTPEQPHRQRGNKPQRHRDQAARQWGHGDESSSTDLSGRRQWASDMDGVTDPDSLGGPDSSSGRDKDSEMNRPDDHLDRAEAVQHKRGHHSRHSVTLIVHVTVGCRTGYWCMRIHRRADRVVQVLTGELAYRAEEACTPHYWDPGSIVATTLVARGEQHRSCGPLGRYIVGPSDPLDESDCAAATVPQYSRLNVGCSAHDTLELHSACPTSDVISYQCHGRWDSEGVTYVVASPTSRPSGSPRRVCFAYSAQGVGGQGMEEGANTPPTVTVTARHDTCSAVTLNAHLSLNATFTGPCAEASGIASSSEGGPLSPISRWPCMVTVVASWLLLSLLSSSHHRQLSS